MPTAAAATYVSTVLFRRRQSSSCARVKGFVLFGRRGGGCSASSGAGLGRLQVPRRRSALSAPPVPLLPGLRQGTTLSAALAAEPRWLQRQPQKATGLHGGRQSPPIAPGGESSRSRGRDGRSREACAVSRHLGRACRCCGYGAPQVAAPAVALRRPGCRITGKYLRSLWINMNQSNIRSAGSPSK